MDQLAKITNIILSNNHTEEKILNLLSSNIESSKLTNVYYINAYLFNRIIDNDEILNIMSKGLVVNDGIGINMLFRFLSGKLKICRTVTTDIWDKLLNICNENNYKIVIYGGKKNRGNEIDNFIGLYPGIKLVKYSDGYSNFDISKYKADIIFVGLGSFKQELFIDSVSDCREITVKIAVGSAIDFWSGAKKRAPLWMRKIGVEWLHRLFQEPRRLWKRYIFGIPVFMFHVFVQKIKLIFKKT